MALQLPTQDIIDAVENGTVRVTRRCAFFERDGETPWYPEGNAEDEVPRLLAAGGQVTAGYDRDERRTFDISLDNRDGLLRPQAGGFWYDKTIKLYRGLYVGDSVAEWQLGEFVIDNIDDESFPKTVKVVGRDQTKKMLQSKLANSESFAAGTKLHELVKALAANSGVSKLGRMPKTSRELGKKLSVERGKDRWTIAKEAAKAKNYDIWFDADGYLRMTEFPDPAAGPVEWTFKTGVDGGNLVDYSRSVNDSELYNVVIVQSEAPDNGIPYYWKAVNSDPGSPTSTVNIGERVMPVITLASADSQQDCKDYARALLKVAALESYNMKFSSILYPWFDSGIVVKVIEPDRLDSDPDRFLLTSVTIPLDLGPMTSESKRITVVKDG